MQGQRLERKKAARITSYNVCYTKLLRYQDIYATVFSVSKHWVLKEHMVMGNYVVPGTSYIEMATEACKKIYGDSPVELKSIFFISPLILEEDSEIQVQTIIKKEEDFLEFVIASLYKDSFTMEEKWIKHSYNFV